MHLGSVRRREGCGSKGVGCGKELGAGKSWMCGDYGVWKFSAMFVFPLLA